MFKLAPRVRETTTSTGTGTLNLAGATTGMQTFVAGVATGNTTRYCIAAANGTDWEVGIGTVTAGSPDTLSRDTVLASTNSGALISLAAGTHRVFCTLDPFGTGRDSPDLSPLITTSANTGLTTWLNQGGATVADSVVGLCITDATGGSFAVRARTKAAPGTPYTIRAKVAATGISTGDWAGLGWYDGTKLHLFGPNLNATGGFGLLVGKLNTVTSYSANDTASVNGIPPRVWLQIGDDGTNVTFSFSLDGANFVTFQNTAKSGAWLGSGGYTTVVFFITPTGGPMHGSLLSWG